MHKPLNFLRATSVAISLLSGAAAWSADESCQLRYPIVLSHMWSVSPICEQPEVTGPKACEKTQDYERHCAQKSTGPDGAPKCLNWRTPDDEADLPPRDHNAHDPSLVRDMRSYHRYFSKAIVSRLRDICGNTVYIADKPPYAGYAVRARSLRATVLQALKETGADKVNVIGMSMGVQDARYMIAVLPIDDAKPDGPRMNTRVASLVSLVGEDGGAESAAIGLATFSMANGGDWSIPPKARDIEETVGHIAVSSWKRQGEPLDKPGALLERCQGPRECDLSDPMDRYRWLLRSVINLSPAYMRPSIWSAVAKPPTNWDKMRAVAGEPHEAWRDIVPAALEAANGVHYMAYGALLNYPQPSWGHPEVFLAVTLFGGPNDSNVSLKRQLFENQAANFETVKVMRGAPLTTGYHHTFFSGRNDRMYSSIRPADQEPAPYGGSSADFHHQLARDLRARGF
jgi:pimeloyl-ACP methyl ester carboxylesterase